jgi:hypothetical protein
MAVFYACHQVSEASRLNLPPITLLCCILNLAVILSSQSPTFFKKSVNFVAVFFSHALLHAFISHHQTLGSHWSILGCAHSTASAYLLASHRAVTRSASVVPSHFPPIVAISAHPPVELQAAYVFGR